MLTPLSADLARTLDLCEYHALFLTEEERAAISRFQAAVPKYRMAQASD